MIQVFFAFDKKDTCNNICILIELPRFIVPQSGAGEQETGVTIIQRCDFLKVLSQAMECSGFSDFSALTYKPLQPRCLTILQSEVCPRVRQNNCAAFGVPEFNLIRL